MSFQIHDVRVNEIYLGVRLREHSCCLCPGLPTLTPLLPVRYSKGENGGISHSHFGEIAFT